MIYSTASVGEGRTPGNSVSVYAAAGALGVTVAAITKRIQSGTIARERGEEGRVWAMTAIEAPNAPLCPEPAVPEGLQPDSEQPEGDKPERAVSRSARGGTREGTERPWWRRVIGGGR
jgi:hypothetical protein